MRFDRKRVEEVASEIATTLSNAGSNTMEGVTICAYLLYEADRQTSVSYDSIITGQLNVPEEIVIAAKRVLNINTWNALNYRQFDPEILKEIILNTEEYMPSNGSAIYTSPVTLIDLANCILNLKENDVVADFGCGYGAYLIKTAKDHPSADYYGYDINTMAKIIAEIRAKVAECDIHIKICNALSLMLPENKELVPNGGFSKIFSNFPFGVRLRHMLDQGGVQYLVKKYAGLQKTGYADWAFMASAVELLADGGKTVCLTTNGSTWNGSDKEIRQYFVENGLVEAVIALPPRMLMSTNVQTSLIVLSRGNKEIRMVDATELYEPGRRYNVLTAEHLDVIYDAYLGDGEYSRTLSFEEIRNNDYCLYPERYLSVEREIENGVPFENITLSISRGAPCTAKELDGMVSQVPTDCQYMSLSNIQNGIIDSELPYLKEISKRYDKYCVRKDMLIMSKVGYPYKVAVMGQTDKKIMANGNLYIIELNTAVVDPVYIKAYLESEAGQNALKSISVGAALPNISVEALKKLTIPLPGMEEQTRIRKEYQAAQDEVVILKRRLAKAQDRLAHVFDAAKEG